MDDGVRYDLLVWANMSDDQLADIEQVALRKVFRFAATKIAHLLDRERGFNSEMFAACLECHTYDDLYNRVAGVLDDYEMIAPLEE